MMAGGTFLPLKGRSGGPESVKQAERRPAVCRKFSVTAENGVAALRRAAAGDMQWLYRGHFAGHD
jgi:hypothetical protein